MTKAVVLTISTALLVTIGLVGHFNKTKSEASDITNVEVPNVVSVKEVLPVKNESDKVAVKKVKQVKIDMDRLIVLEGPIGGNAVDAALALNELNAENNKPVYILIDSNGGKVIDGGMLLSAMEASKAPVYTICHRVCASMAAIIHQYGTKRYMIDRSILMFHPASAGTQGTIQQMKSFSDFLNKYVEKIDLYIVAKSKLTMDEYKLMVQHEIWIDAEDSLSLGFTDEIVNPIMTKSSSQSYFVESTTDTSDERTNNSIEGLVW